MYAVYKICISVYIHEILFFFAYSQSKSDLKPY